MAEDLWERTVKVYTKEGLLFVPDIPFESFSCTNAWPATEREPVNMNLFRRLNEEKKERDKKEREMWKNMGLLGFEALICRGYIRMDCRDSARVYLQLLSGEKNIMDLCLDESLLEAYNNEVRSDLLRKTS